MNLAEQHMAAFEQDPDVMKFVSMGRVQTFSA